MSNENNEIKINNEERTEIGKVTTEERDEIKGLFERKNGLLELTKSLMNVSKEELENSYLYEKITKDMGKVSIEFQAWWDKMSQKYKWQSKPGYKWEIDFDKCTIFIKKQ